MNAAWNFIGVVAVLAAVAVPLSAQETVKEGAKVTKDVVVKDATIVAEHTKDGLSKRAR